ncbi:MAG: TonB-dependent receptor plug domain-containing protein, partial [Holophaga sp.]|nr:TonB-dependent receptor plug domain-containing protein [Holophaga sp.]
MKFAQTAVFFLLVAPVFSQAPQATELEAELLALLDTTVTVAGKKAQKISEAPAIISVITAEDLRNQGVTNVYEALSLLPGINLTETFYGYTSVGFRGNLQAHYNNKWLFMLNDHPMFEPVTGDSRFESVPLSQIKRIE